jgi:hypothetical protein
MLTCERPVSLLEVDVEATTPADVMEIVEGPMEIEANVLPDEDGGVEASGVGFSCPGACHGIFADDWSSLSVELRRRDLRKRGVALRLSRRARTFAYILAMGGF